ncbi:hypothetical protein J5N97_016627 [Dioscorea zingiberensis]|uniref:Association with the SNF1 complex (ASC) domain-containing protein n=1 Tax=Dioscorea zingiberensis TaxID=325984 RepID=A0A9D5CK83_9LILI|nr:hypothetical protein J5N97_016627 [Dioscorea zingiberensis]
MGNSGGKEGRGLSDAGADDNSSARSDHVVSIHSVDPMVPPTPEIPPHHLAPLMFAPQVPLVPLQSSAEVPQPINQLWMNNSIVPLDSPIEKGIPTLITWNNGGNNVAIEGSWDNWTSRKALQRSGKDHAIMFVLPSGVYQYKFIVDGQWRYISDLPCIADEMGHMTNLLDVHDSVPENIESVSRFEAPSSPDSSYSQRLPFDEDFSKEPPDMPPQLGMVNLEDSSKPQHHVLNHLFLERGWAAQSLFALSLTHRFQAKFVTVVLYTPLRN